MSYGLNLYDGQGRLHLSSDSMAFSIVDVFTTGVNTNGSKAYPELAGKTIQIQTSGRGGVYEFTSGYLPYTFSVDYALGYPRVSWSLNSQYRLSGSWYFAHVVYVALLRVPASLEYGFEASNSSGELVASYTSRNYQYIGLATTQSNFGNQTYTHGHMTASIVSPGGEPLFFVENIQGQFAFVQHVARSGDSYTARIAKNTSSIPRVLCFAQSSATQIGSGYGLALFGPSGEVFLDSTKSILSSPLYITKTTPSTATSGNDALYTIPGTNVLSTTGGHIPYSSACMSTAGAFCGTQVNYSGSRYLKDNYVAIMKSGATFYSGWLTVFYSQYPYETFYPISQNLSDAPRVYVIDISQYE